MKKIQQAMDRWALPFRTESKQATWLNHVAFADTLEIHDSWPLPSSLLSIGKKSGPLK